MKRCVGSTLFSVKGFAGAKACAYPALEIGGKSRMVPLDRLCWYGGHDTETHFIAVRRTLS